MTDTANANANETGKHTIAGIGQHHQPIALPRQQLQLIPWASTDLLIETTGKGRGVGLEQTTIDTSLVEGTRLPTGDGMTSLTGPFRRADHLRVVSAHAVLLSLQDHQGTATILAVPRHLERG